MNPTVALIIIGDEILSGRTLDKNTQHIAQTLGQVGVDLKQVRVISDDEEKIVSTVNELRAEYDYVFTTGGIGPTHDDITAESIAKAFDTELVQDEQAYSLLVEYYGKKNLNEGRLKMANVPRGARLINNPVTVAPGFNIKNVYVMAGVPKIMHGMLENIIPELDHGAEIKTQTVKVFASESKISGILGDLQSAYSEISIGSYPSMISEDFKKFEVNVVFRSQDENLIANAILELAQKLKENNFEFSND